MLGSIGAACPSVAGSSRLPTSRNVEFSAGSPHASRLAALPFRLEHAAVELFRGTMVSHSFIAYRDDSADESQPITFAGDSWRDYIPIRSPWTVCVRERLPPGSVAVLINQSHTFTDLICTVDSFEDRLLGAIDGSRPSAIYFDLRFRAAMVEVSAAVLRAHLAIRPNCLRRMARRRKPTTNDFRAKTCKRPGWRPRQPPGACCLGAYRWGGFRLRRSALLALA